MSATSSQVYCAGAPYRWGSGGWYDDTGYVSVSTPQKVTLPSGLYAKSVETQGNQTCIITTSDDMYCAGQNNLGQLTGSTLDIIGLTKYNLPGNRKVKDVLISYHFDSTVHVLATDGTVWGSGDYVNGDVKTGITSGSTGGTQTPSLFGAGNSSYGTGSSILGSQSGRCIDNTSNSSANGNKIELYDCNNSVAQLWVYTDSQTISNIGTGKCLDNPNNSSTPATALQLYDCNGTAAQQFTISSNGTILHNSSGMCVDAFGSATGNGTIIGLYTCTSGANQNFAPTGQGINAWQGIIQGYDFFCAIRDDDYSGLWCAGRNNYGQLANYHSPTVKDGDACVSTPENGLSIVNANLAGADDEEVDYTKLSSEWQYQYDSLMVITKSGQVYGAGRNAYGKLGSGSLGDASNSYRQCATVRFQLPAGVSAVDMSTRDEFSTYVLGSNGVLYSVGRNDNGQLGNGSLLNTSLPVTVAVPRQERVY